MQIKAPSNLREIGYMSGMLLLLGIVFGYGVGPIVFKFLVTRVSKL